MAYEVEQKFPAADLGCVDAELGRLGATVSDRQEERDLYFRHPSRDFARTDEALRVRRTGESNFLTYKGPKIDATTKTRQEIDLPLPPGESAADAWGGLLQALGFTPVAEVRKLRRKAHVVWHEREVEISLDEVDRVGTFVELELVVDEDQLDAARRCIAALADRLGLERSERRSYLELLLAGEQKSA
jgi:adenylate cyclase class 2